MFKPAMGGAKRAMNKTAPLWQPRALAPGASSKIGMRPRSTLADNNKSAKGAKASK
jgi:hypothetical protein